MAAEKNQLDSAKSDEIIGQPLRHFIKDESTQMLLEAMFDLVRLTKAPLRFQYRCDTPTARRLMAMELKPVGNLIEVQHELIEQMPRQTAVYYSPVPITNTMQHCSMCERLWFDEQWVEADQIQAKQPDLLNEVFLIHTVCKNCSNIDNCVRETLLAILPLSNKLVKLLITGGTGFVGQAVIAHLLNTTYEVTLLLREPYASDKPLPPTLRQLRSQFDVVYADLRNFRLTVRAVQQAAPDVVLHLAAAGVTDPFLPVDTAVRYNVTGTLNLVRACFEKTFNTQKLIVSRTPGERSNMNHYAASKKAAWDFCQMYAQTQGWPIVGGMIFQAYGLGQPAHTLVQAALRAALAGQDFPMTAGKQQRDWIALPDLVTGLTAMITAALNPGTTIELGTGQLTSVADVVRLIYRLVDKGGEPLVGRLPSRPGETAVQVADAAKTAQLIGWQATHSLEAGLKRMIAAPQNRQSKI